MSADVQGEIVICDASCDAVIYEHGFNDGPGFSTRACELGTDCDDCGDSCRARIPRMEASPAPEDAFVGPEEEVVIVQ